MTGTQATVTGAVFLVAIRYGEGGMSATDLSLIALAGGGLIGWVVAGEPIVAVGCVIAADLIGVAMMTRRSTATLTLKPSRHTRWPASGTPSPRAPAACSICR